MITFIKFGCFLLFFLFGNAYVLRGQLLEDNPITTVGLYAFEPAEREHYLFWKACGYNLLQFIDVGLSLPPQEKKTYYERLERAISEAQGYGFKVSIILQSNILPYPANWYDTFDPKDRMAMESRLSSIDSVIERCKMADMFTFFAGDPGGSQTVLGDEGVQLWKAMSKNVQRMVERKAPKAIFNANIWAVTHWDHIQISPWATTFWDKEAAYARQLAEDVNFIDIDCGIEFPLHNYYRSLAFKAYEDVAKVPPLYPLAADAEQLRARGVKRMWGWAHFLIDEVDDGYTGYAGTKVHPSQAETRYLHRIVSDARNIGLNGMISNCGGPNSLIEAMNVYAFARFCQNANLTPGEVIDEYAGYLTADEASKLLLGQIIRFIENHSTWESSIPEKYRIEPMVCKYMDAGEALLDAGKIKPDLQPEFPVPESPALYIEKLKQRLLDIQQQG